MAVRYEDLPGVPLTPRGDRGAEEPVGMETRECFQHNIQYDQVHQSIAAMKKLCNYNWNTNEEIHDLTTDGKSTDGSQSLLGVVISGTRDSAYYAHF